MLLRKTIRRRRLRRFHFIPFLLLFAEILDRAPYRKNACVFESGFLGLLFHRFEDLIA